MKILFVCTGNTCRSCMAEAIAKKLASEGQKRMEFSSSGIYAVMGESASSSAVTAMEEMGIDLSCHIATPVSGELLEEADLVLTMTQAHRLLLLNHYPEQSKKIATLLGYVGEAGDIEDPFGGDQYLYRDCALQLKTAIEKLLLKIKEEQGN